MADVVLLKLNPGQTLNDFGLNWNNLIENYLAGLDPIGNANKFLTVRNTEDGIELVLSSTSPSPPDRAIQYNSGGTFTGSPDFTFQNAPNRLEVMRIKLTTAPTPNQNNPVILGWDAAANNFQDVQPEDWIDIVPINGFTVGLNQPQYRRTITGEVEFRGQIQVSGGAELTTMFNLPASYRPSQNKYFITSVTQGDISKIPRVLIETNGNVEYRDIFGVLTLANQINLNSIIFTLSA